MKKKILITGGSGLLGLNWAISTRDQYEVILGLNRNFVKLEKIESCLLTYSDTQTLEKQIEIIAPDIIIHTAGLTSVEICEREPDLANDINTELAANIALISSRLKSKLIHISTDHLFDGTQPNSTETSLPHPLNIYASSKRKAEEKISVINPLALIIRTNFFGWGPTYRASFSDTILNTLRAGKDIYLFEDVYFTPILIQNLIKATHELEERNVSGLIHVVGDERISKYEFGRLLAQEFGISTNHIKSIHFSDKAGLTRRPMDLSISNKKVCSLLNRSLGDIPSQLRMLRELESDPLINTIREL